MLTLVFNVSNLFVFIPKIIHYSFELYFNHSLIGRRINGIFG